MNMIKLNRLLATVLLGSALALPLPAAVAAGQQSFATPEAAMEAFGTAVIDSDEGALRAMFGADFRQLFPRRSGTALQVPRGLGQVAQDRARRRQSGTDCRRGEGLDPADTA